MQMEDVWAGLYYLNDCFIQVRRSRSVQCRPKCEAWSVSAFLSSCTVPPRSIWSPTQRMSHGAGIEDLGKWTLLWISGLKWNSLDITSFDSFSFNNFLLIIFLSLRWCMPWSSYTNTIGSESYFEVRPATYNYPVLDWFLFINNLSRIQVHKDKNLFPPPRIFFLNVLRLSLKSGLENPLAVYVRNVPLLFLEDNKYVCYFNLPLGRQKILLSRFKITYQKVFWSF